MTGQWSCMSLGSYRAVYWLTCQESLNISLSLTHNNRVPELQLLSCSVVVYSAVIVFYFHTDQEPDSINRPQGRDCHTKTKLAGGCNLNHLYVCKKWPMSTVKGNPGKSATLCGITWWPVSVDFIIEFMNSAMQLSSSRIFFVYKELNSSIIFSLNVL